MSSNVARFDEMFAYHSQPLMPTEPTETVVFGRHDSRLANAMGSLCPDGLVSHFTISGGFGKDSGELWDLRLPEARFVGRAALAGGYGITSGDITYEFKALTGDDNARFSLQKIQQRRSSEHLPPLSAVTALAHATSLRRLAATLQHEAAALELPVNTVCRVPTKYPFDASNPRDQKEAAAELLRLAYWPEKGWLEAQPDLPENLVDFAHSVIPDIPGRPSPMRKRILRAAPHTMRRRMMEAG